MPPELEDLSTEHETELDTAGGGKEGTDGSAAKPADGAGSSAAQTQTEDEGLLGIVRDAAPSKKPDPSAASSAEASEAGKPGAEPPKQPDNENYSDVPFNKHPRFRQLLSENKANKGDAERYRQVDTFIRDNGMSAQEAADLLTVGAMAKTNPAKAWELARPWVENLLKAAGEVLSPELTQAVESGQMTREAAYEVSRARASVASVEASRSFETRRASEKAESEASAAITDAARDWETERAARDPNFAAKVEPILREITWRKAQGDVPKNAAEVKAQLDDVYKAVNAALAPPAAASGAAPRPGVPRKATTPVVGGSVAAGNAKPAPRSMLEVIQQAAP